MTELLAYGSFPPSPSFSEECRIRRFQVSHIRRHRRDWWMLDIMSHFERRNVLFRLWFSLDFSDCALVAAREFAEGVVHPLIISVGAEWPEGRVVFVNVFLGRRHFLLRQRGRANWTDYIHWVVECPVVEPLTVLRLPCQWVERLLLKL